MRQVLPALYCLCGEKERCYEGKKLRFSSESEAAGDLAVRADKPWTVQRENVALEEKVTVYRGEFKGLTYNIDFP